MEGHRIRAHTRSSWLRWRLIGNSGMVLEGFKRRWPSSSESLKRRSSSGCLQGAEAELLQGRFPLFRVGHRRIESPVRADSVHEAQVLNYLKATGLSIGLLPNLGTPRLVLRRLIFSTAPLRICGQFPARIDHGPQEERLDACVPGA